MQLTFDPIAPWSSLVAYLTGAPLAAVVAASMVGVILFCMPIVAHLRPRGASPRQVIRGAALAILSLVCWGLVSGSSSGNINARLNGLAMWALLALPFALAGLTVWTYLGVPGATSRRIAGILTLRLLAFLLALLAMLRPSLAMPEPDQDRGLIIIVADSSASMTIKDEIDNRSRWEQLLLTLRDAAAALDRLANQSHIDVVYQRFADEVADFSPGEPGKADGKRTDMGQMLKKLYENRDGQKRPRGLLILSDGADNGTRFPALAETNRWRGASCPVHTFAYGKPTTSDRQSDISVTAITSEPSPVPVKGELTIKATVDAPGFENRKVRVRLFLDDKEVAAQDEMLPLTTGNEIKLKTTAPTLPGEVKVTLRVEDPQRPGQALPGELSEANNEIGTYVTVAREGISVLLVDKQRAWEPTFICDALSKDSRIRLYPVWLRRDQADNVQAADLFQFDRHQYDAVILGDVTAKQIKAANPAALAAIERLVFDKGSGLLMLGGYSTFGNGDWKGTELEKLLPVKLTPTTQVETPVKMVPTPQGLQRFAYVLRLGDNQQQTVDAWGKLRDLEGHTKLGEPKPGLASILATTAAGDPLLVTQNFGNGRTLAFGGDTTYRWVRNPESQQMHSRFWRQMVIWLAKQEEAEGSVWVKPDTRRLPARSDLGFSVGLRSKGGVDLRNGTFKVEVFSPDGSKTDLTTAPAGNDERGTFGRTDAPGEYRVVVRGEGKDADGNEIKGNATARFLVFDEDLETTRRAADHDFLKKLASAGGGEFHRGEELARFLESLQQQPNNQIKPRLIYFPNWRSTGRSPFLIGFFLAFVLLLGGEWIMRRYWGLV